MKLQDYLHTTDRIPNDLLIEAAISTEIDELSVLREVVTYHRDRICGRIPDSCLEAVVRYFVKCVRDNSKANDLIHSRFEAAKELSRLFEHFLEWNPAQEKWLTMISNEVTVLYRSGDRATKNAVETGFLEHCLEVEGARRYFVNWHDDPALAEAFAFALAWGKAHGRSVSDNTPRINEN